MHMEGRGAVWKGKELPREPARRRPSGRDGLERIGRQGRGPQMANATESESGVSADSAGILIPVPMPKTTCGAGL